MKMYQAPVVDCLREDLKRLKAENARQAYALDMLIGGIARGFALREKRIADLLEANNRLLQRARDAEKKLEGR